MSSPLNLAGLKKLSQQQQAPAPAPVPTPAAPAPAAKPSGLMNLNLGGLPKRAETPPAKPVVAGVAEESSGGVEPAAVEDASKQGASLLTSIALDDSSALPSLSDQFPDEIPAQAPERQLPEDMDETMKQFVDSLDGIFNPAVIHDPELCGQYIRTIMSELQKNPQYIRLVHDDDVATMIRGMRESMGLARMKKMEAREKRSGGSRKSKTSAENQAIQDDLAALAESFGMQLES